MSIIQLCSHLPDIFSNSDTPVVVEYFASWCPKCSMMSAIYERVARKLSPDILFYKIDVDENTELVEHLGIEIYPTFIVYYQGKILGYTSGVLSETILRNRILALSAKR